MSQTAKAVLNLELANRVLAAAMEKATSAGVRVKFAHAVISSATVSPLGPSIAPPAVSSNPRGEVLSMTAPGMEVGRPLAGKPLPGARAGSRPLTRSTLG